MKKSNNFSQMSVTSGTNMLENDQNSKLNDIMLHSSERIIFSLITDLQ